VAQSLPGVRLGAVGAPGPGLPSQRCNLAPARCRDVALAVVIKPPKVDQEEVEIPSHDMARRPAASAAAGSYSAVEDRSGFAIWQG
jgi:hypothetical protein